MTPTPDTEAPEGGKAQSTDRYSWTATGMKRDPAGSWVVAGVAGCRAEQRGPAAEWVCDCKQMRPDCKPNAGVDVPRGGQDAS